MTVLELPGCADTHSHGFHRALRGRTQARGEGSSWTLADADVDALASAGVVAGLLPGVEFSTRSPYPDAPSYVHLAYRPGVPLVRAVPDLRR